MTDLRPLGLMPWSWDPQSGRNSANDFEALRFSLAGLPDVAYSRGMDGVKACGRCFKPKSEVGVVAEAYCECGRPTEYESKFCDQLIEFFNVEPYREVEVTITYKDGREETRSEERANDLPTLAAFARTIGVHRDTIHEWSKQHPEFSDAIKRAKDFQEDVWVTNGMKGYYPAAFAIFFGKNNLGYKDKTETDITMKKDGAALLADAILDAGSQDETSHA